MSPAFFAGSQEGFCYPLHHFEPATAILALILVDWHILRTTSCVFGQAFGGFFGIDSCPPAIADRADYISMLAPTR